MPDTIVLRFRDLVAGADTIVEHQKLITEVGYVWWGWWKKEDEPDRAEELEQVKSLVAKRELEIGLFDRSEKGRFFKAGMLQCVSEKNRLTESPEPRATPSYYRDKRVSAWFKLSRIDSLSPDDSSYMRLFAVIPGGEATLFPVWIDKPQRTLAAGIITSVVPGSISAKGNAVLHISDIHFGEYAYPPAPGPAKYPLTDILIGDLAKLDAKVGLVVVSGDLTTRADGNRLFNEALPFLQDLAKRLKIEVEQVVIAPGNHDIPLKEHDPFNNSHENTYKTFLKQFYGTPTELFQMRRFDINGLELELLTMNSIKLRSKQLKEYGYVQWPLYDDLLRSQPDSKALRMAVLHHHLVAAPREEKPPDPEYSEAAVSMSLDAGAIIEGLQSYGFRIALHGHQHVPQLTKIARGRAQDDSSVKGLDDPLYVIGGGSVGASRLFDEMRDNTYNLLLLPDKISNKVQLRIRRFNAGSPPRDHINQTFAL